MVGCNSGCDYYCSSSFKYLYRAFCQEKSTERKGGINLMSEKNTKKAAPVRDLSVKQGFKISRFLVSWEIYFDSDQSGLND